jgi:hypothetical protein
MDRTKHNIIGEMKKCSVLNVEFVPFKEYLIFATEFYIMHFAPFQLEYTFPERKIMSL